MPGSRGPPSGMTSDATAGCAVKGGEPGRGDPEEDLRMDGSSRLLELLEWLERLAWELAWEGGRTTAICCVIPDTCCVMSVTAGATTDWVVVVVEVVGAGRLSVAAAGPSAAAAVVGLLLSSAAALSSTESGETVALRCFCAKSALLASIPAASALARAKACCTSPMPPRVL